MKRLIVLFSFFISLAQFPCLQADRTLLYSFDIVDHNAESWIYYADQLIFNASYLTSDSTEHLKRILTSGETYLLKVTYSIGGFEEVDSCFTTFTYVPEGFDPENPYTDNGTLAFGDQSFGFYNIKCPVSYDPDLFGDDCDFTEGELEGILSTFDYCFIMTCTSYTRVKIEIYQYD